MYREKDHWHYSREEIKEKFRENIDNRNWPINESEYDQLCKLLSCLDTKLVDMVKDEVHIITYSQQKDVTWDDKIVFACYLNLRDQSLIEQKKGVIFLSPDFLDKKYEFMALKKLFHEIGHHQLDCPMDVVDPKERDDAAENLALEWLQQEKHHLDDDS